MFFRIIPPRIKLKLSQSILKEISSLFRLLGDGCRENRDNDLLVRIDIVYFNFNLMKFFFEKFYSTCRCECPQLTN